MAEVSPMIAYETGAAPRVKSTETMRPKEAWAREAAVDLPTDPATPRATSRMVLTAEPQR